MWSSESLFELPETFSLDELIDKDLFCNGTEGVKFSEEWRKKPEMCALNCSAQAFSNLVRYGCRIAGWEDATERLTSLRDNPRKDLGR